MLDLTITVTYLPENDVVPSMISCMLIKENGEHHAWIPFLTLQEACDYFVTQNWERIRTVKLRYDVNTTTTH